MNLDDQVSILRGYYRNEIERVYDKRFQMRLMSVMAFDQNAYLKLMQSVEITSSITESSVIDCNPKRMLRYLFVLRSAIDGLIEKTEKDYKKMWDNKLTH